MDQLPCDRCGREIPPEDLATGICWSCGFMYDLDKVMGYEAEPIR